MFKIDKKITGYKVVDKSESSVPQVQEQTLETMHEGILRTPVLHGSTYKIKTPQSDHAMYITINDMVLNLGTEEEKKYPYEVFINSKNMENFQWILAVTRLISAVWRKGGDCTFLIDELKAVFDPRGGYYKRGGIYMPSIVAEIAYTIEVHLKSTGYLVQEVDENMQKFLEQKKSEFKEQESSSDFPSTATLCPKCNVKAVIIMDGCQTCLSCGDSKCN